MDEEKGVMATVENVILGITASAGKPGYSDIAYSYELHPDESDSAEEREFTVTVSLWGEDVFDDDVLAVELDEHMVNFSRTTPGEPLKVARVFDVETKLLDEDVIGDDEVYLVVEARSESGTGLALEERVSGRSNVVIGDF
jgi:arginine repressor